MAHVSICRSSVLDYLRMVQTMRQRLLETFIQETFGGLSARVYRILTAKKVLDEKAVVDS
jgi:hypothetical protein